MPRAVRHLARAYPLDNARGAAAVRLREAIEVIPV